MSRLIHAFKANKPLIVQLTPRGNYTKPKEHNRLDRSRIFGCDTESFYNPAYGALFDRHAKKWVGDSGLRTNMVQLDFVDAKDSIILDTTLYEYPLEMLLDYIWAKFAVYEEYSSSTKQRAIRKRTTGTNAGLDIRDGRREFI